jgi:hypothetical protein
MSVPKGDVMGPETAMATAGGLIARNGKEVERLRRQVEVMLAYALDKGLTPAPQAWMFDAVREQPSSIDLGGDGWATSTDVDTRSSTDALVRAHRDLSRLVAPARPASIELLHGYREGRRAPRVRIPRQQGRPGTPGAGLATPRLHLRRPRLPGIGSTVPLVRWLMIATIAFLVLFVLFAASPDAREAITGRESGVSVGTGQEAEDHPVVNRPDRREIGADGVTDDYEPARFTSHALGGGSLTARAASEPALGGVDVDASYARLLLRELFLLCAAGLGACLTALYRASRDVARGTYDPEFDHTFLQRVVLGMATGLILAELLPIGAGASPLVLPAVALVGGFAASVVQRLLSRVVAALEALFNGDPDEQEDARRELAQKRADDVLAQAERANLATLLEIRRIAASGAPVRAVIDEIDRVIVQVSPS